MVYNSPSSKFQNYPGGDTTGHRYKRGGTELEGKGPGAESIGGSCVMVVGEGMWMPLHGFGFSTRPVASLHAVTVVIVLCHHECAPHDRLHAELRDPHNSSRCIYCRNPLPKYWSSLPPGRAGASLSEPLPPKKNTR